MRNTDWHEKNIVKQKSETYLSNVEKEVSPVWLVKFMFRLMKQNFSEIDLWCVPTTDAVVCAKFTRDLKKVICARIPLKNQRTDTLIDNIELHINYIAFVKYQISDRISAMRIPDIKLYKVMLYLNVYLRVFDTRIPNSLHCIFCLLGLCDIEGNICQRNNKIICTSIGATYWDHRDYNFIVMTIPSDLLLSHMNWQVRTCAHQRTRTHHTLHRPHTQ